MPQTVRHADLVARALGALSESERARVDQALEADPRLRRQFEQIAGHLLQYDHLPPAPPPPPYARLAAAIEADLETAQPRSAAPDLRVLALLEAKAGRRTWLPAAAALVVACVLIWATWRVPHEQATDAGSALSLVAGTGIELMREGVALPAPARARVQLRDGDVLSCRAPAEARLGDQVRLVLDAGTRLRIGALSSKQASSNQASPKQASPNQAGSNPASSDQATAVLLQAGRAWFQVEPAKGTTRRSFEVDTPHGPVRVLGTIFEVDVRGGSLDVAVERGRVQAGGHVLTAGERLVSGALKQHGQRPGSWFRRPTLRLEAQRPGPHPLATALTLRLILSNPSHLPMHLAAPAAARTPLWLSFETLEGKVLRDLPVLGAQVRAGGNLLKAGRGLDLSPGESRVITLEILPPVGSPGAYRCRALYRPEGQQPLLSSPLAFEVR